MTNVSVWDHEADVVVVGSGSGAMTCALTAAERGARVVMLERASQVGGGTAYSGGLIWVPNNHRMLEAGLEDSEEDAFTYIRGTSGGKHDEGPLQAFVKTGPKVFQYLEKHAGISFEIAHFPDYNVELPGGKADGRALHAPVFDTRTLGEWQDRLVRSPHFPLPATFSELSRWGGINKVAGWDWGLIRQRMEQGVVGYGCAYSGYLLKACLDRGVKIMLETRASQLLTVESGRVVGVRARTQGGEIAVRARKGVLLGSGGFEWNDALKRRLPWPHFVAYSIPTNEGDGLLMALRLGAAFSLVEVISSCTLHIPGEEHMGKPLYRLAGLQVSAPGTILVNRKGKRFCNESFRDNIDERMRDYDPEVRDWTNLPCYVVFDKTFKDKYAIGTSLPGEEAPDWIARGQTLRDLARKLQIDGEGLEDTVKRFNEYAKKGDDPEFHRGSRTIDRYFSGDPTVKPNPCLAPLKTPPFYGLRIYLSSSGTKSGLVIDEHARVKNVDGEAILGLYACPNAAAHVAVGKALTSGMTLSQSTTFGHLAALDMTR